MLCTHEADGSTPFTSTMGEVIYQPSAECCMLIADS